ncbi:MULTISPECIES: arabinose transporter [Pantoea]|jgi:MFS family permease|uniref:arabinose transporter n=1 Tax=Pantoea TaxID=53335 RepID=UPI00104A03F5|nr:MULTISPECIES: arabinose transporter [Pantoea]MDQ0435572.1 MFS family permease [Pantoea agglomerans]NEG88332.1 MFS transporter [Pantoea agglomerans]NEH10352.1 MFS transporter [Pantoea agglomerans]TCZ24915.1 MFS transporter [Pantoea agglomerans]TSH79231.1 MFS transporter [Pantoea sp. paga]
MDSSAAGIDYEAKGTRYLFRLTLAVFLSYLTISLPLPALSLYVHNELHMDDFAVGMVIGAQFLSTILTRGYAGKLADTYGGRYTTRRGMLFCAIACLLYLLSGYAFTSIMVKFVLLLIARIIMGYGESLLLTGNMAWGFHLLGDKHLSRVMSWQGLGTFGSLAAGAPIGYFLYTHTNFLTLSLVTLMLPFIALLINAPVPTVVVESNKARPRMMYVIAKILPAGIILSLQSSGFAAIGAFISLLFQSRQWINPGFAITMFGVMFLLMRIFFGHFPQRYGWIRVSAISLLLEALGLVIICLSGTETMALLGSAITGIGCSLFFPAMGVVAMKRVPVEARGMAAGGFSAFQDMAYMVTGPICGLIAGHAGYSAVYGLCAILSLIGAFLSLRLSVNED